jgi:hypothetical protein
VASSKQTAQATANKTINLVRHVCFVIVSLTLHQFLIFFNLFAATSPNFHLLPLSHCSMSNFHRALNFSVQVAQIL